MVDVTRIEHENLFNQVAEIARTMRRIELELLGQRDRIDAIERDIESLLKQPGIT